MRVYQNRAKFDPRQKFSTWLYTIATNLSRDRLRWRSRHPQVSLDSEDERSGTTLVKNLPAAQAAPDKQLESSERAEAVRKAVAALPEELRTALILIGYEGRSQAEAGAILNCSVKTVEMRIYRARNRLRQVLAELLKTM